MHLSTPEQAALKRTFALLAEDLGEREVRLTLGEALLELLRADQFASFVWDAEAHRFNDGVWLHMDPANLARYDAWFQYHDPITFKLQARRRATAVSEVMPHRELARTEFFNDFLARDGLHWGINLHAFDGDRALGDLRIWRARTRREFEPHDKALLDLIEPAFIAALRRAQRASVAPAAIAEKARPGEAAFSPREREVALAVLRGLTDKQIARELGLSVSSVRTYLGRLFEKTGATRRAGLAQWGRAAALTNRSP
jgi:DNA-binding CsgD family transcriptional regulator